MSQWYYSRNGQQQGPVSCRSVSGAEEIVHEASFHGANFPAADSSTSPFDNLFRFFGGLRSIPIPQKSASDQITKHAVRPGDAMGEGTEFRDFPWNLSILLIATKPFTFRHDHAMNVI